MNRSHTVALTGANGFVGKQLEPRCQVMLMLLLACSLAHTLCVGVSMHIWQGAMGLYAMFGYAFPRGSVGTSQNPISRFGEKMKLKNTFNNKKLAITISIIAFCLLIFYLFVQYDRFVESDRCFDRGGAWDYQKNVCRF